MDHAENGCPEHEVEAATAVAAVRRHLEVKSGRDDTWLAELIRLTALEMDALRARDECRSRGGGSTAESA